MSENWTELKIQVPASQGELAGDIANMVVPYGIYMEDYSHLEEEAMEIAHIDLIDEELLRKDREHAVIHVYISPEENPAEAVSYLEERYNALGIPHTITLDNCVKEDWINNWKKYFHPIPVGEKLLIRPLWEEQCDPQGRIVLDLEPGLAFGTGTHETTRLCLELLEKYLTPGCDFLDMGCGSGILSVAALLLGAKSAVGVDIDPLAVKTAVENANTNGVGGEVHRHLRESGGESHRKVPGGGGQHRGGHRHPAEQRRPPVFWRRTACTSSAALSTPGSRDVLDAIGGTFQVLERREEKGWIAMALKLK